MAAMANYSLKAYLVNTTARGDRITLWGAVMAVLSGGFSKGLNIMKRAKTISRFGMPAVYRYLRAFR